MGGQLKSGNGSSTTVLLVNPEDANGGEASTSTLQTRSLTPQIIPDAVARIPSANDIAPYEAKRARAILIILQVSMVNFFSSFVNGIITVGLPRIASDLSLSEELYFWPNSVCGLTTGSTLLLAGAIADVLGSRTIDLIGCALIGSFVLGCGLSTTGVQLVVFRAFQGIGSAMHLPCSVALVTQYVPNGKNRNIGFACLGLSQPLGFSVGLVLGGVFVDTVGWRVGFYIAAAVLILQTIAGLKIIPADPDPQNVPHKLKTEIDWFGAFLACTGLAMLSYVLAILSTSSDNIKHPSAISLLTVSSILILAFPIWMALQEKHQRPALIPNNLWKNLPFSCICVLTVLTWGVMNSEELFSSLYFQEVQQVSALQASLRIMPAMIIGAILNLTTGYFADKAPAFWLVLISTTLTAGSPLLMALIDPNWSYWKGAFFAQVLAPISGDVLFTVGLIIVSEGFPEKTQALAGAVFNTVACFGISLGLNVTQVISMLVTKGSEYSDKQSPAALLKGYQASFWAMFGTTLACSLLCILGLRKVGSIGLKKD